MVGTPPAALAAKVATTTAGVEALPVGPDISFTSRRVQLVTLVVQHMLPVIYFGREFVEASGIMSYGTSITEQHRQVDIYTSSILKGKSPGDLPVLYGSKFKFFINLQTARSLGVTVPPALLAIANEVIE